MAVQQARMSRAVTFVLKNGVLVHPVQVKRRDNGVVGYRISKGGNTLDESETVDEQTMVMHVRSGQYAVRCASADGRTTGLYKPGRRSVATVDYGDATS